MIVTTSQLLSTGVDAQTCKLIVLDQNINSPGQFKQIIGRGTRTFDGKDYFTIYDFVKAYAHFNDPEWDGDPLPPEPDDPVIRPDDPEIPPDDPEIPPDDPDDEEPRPGLEKLLGDIQPPIWGQLAKVLFKKNS